MSDTHRRYGTVRKALDGLYPFEAEGHVAQRLNTLSALVCGIVGSKRTHLPHIAGQVPRNGILTESLIKRFSRFLDNDHIELDLYYLPYVEVLLKRLAHLPLVLVMDGSGVGRGCVTLMLSVVYKKRALPLVWLVAKGKKGHFPEESHLLLLEQIHPLIPEKAKVIFLGDGEFDGIVLQERIRTYTWDYVCRTAKNIQITKDYITFSFQQEHITPGTYKSLKKVLFTEENYGPVHAIIWWEKGYEEPLYLVTNIQQAAQAVRWYKKRFSIETFFSDTKSRGFHLHKSHISDPQRLERLMIAACLAYIWIVYLGLIAIEDGWTHFIHRSDRCDLGLFQLGLRLLEYFFNDDEDLPLDFHKWTFKDT